MGRGVCDQKPITEFTLDKKKVDLKAVKDLCGDEMEEAEESKERTDSIDGGTLVYMYISYAYHRFLCAVEHCMRRHMQVDK